MLLFYSPFRYFIVSVLFTPFRAEAIVLFFYHLFLCVITLSSDVCVCFFSDWTHAFDYNFRKRYSSRSSDIMLVIWYRANGVKDRKQEKNLKFYRLHAIWRVSIMMQHNNIAIIAPFAKKKKDDSKKWIFDTNKVTRYTWRRCVILSDFRQTFVYCKPLNGGGKLHFDLKTICYAL